jgi:Secretion system C-terminal sorting domain
LCNGYDIKQPGKAASLSNSRINQVFIEDGMTVLRVPIYAAAAHPSEGMVTESEYTDVLNAINRVKAIKPSVKIFASLRLEGDATFNDWVVNSPTNRTVVAAKMALMVRDYLVFMKNKNLTVDVLGVDNEAEYNGGNITPSKYKTIIDLLKIDAQNGLFTMPPLLVAPENYGPNNGNTWLTTLNSNNWQDRYDIAGIHYYPHLRPLSSLTNFCNTAGSKIKWNTEIHWDTKADVEDQLEAEQGLIAIFDGFDLGMTGMTWWSYGTGTDFRSLMNRQLVRSTNGATVIDADDIDGRNMIELTKLNTRAFKKGNDLFVWVLNNRTNVLTNHKFRLATGLVVGTPTFTQWVNEVQQTGSATVNNNIVTLTLPAYSYTLLKITFSAIVPVELTYFQGKNNQTHNLLTWQTASETHNSHFDIERSNDKLTFENIGQVKGNGSTQQPINYSFTDTKPNTLNYYRLKQVDFDGKERFSHIVSLQNSKNSVKIYPSVSSTFLTVELPSETEFATVIITDILGRNLVRQNTPAGQEVNISSLVAGTYFISIDVKGSKTTQRFIKN